MPWPNFSELTFGIAFLREFEATYTQGGQTLQLSTFPTQNQEAESGYDVESVGLGGMPIFFQFKRSFEVSTRAGREFKPSVGPLYWSNPSVYRMNFHSKNRHQQHRALRRLRGDGHEAYYVTSQVPDLNRLKEAYENRTVINEAAALFDPEDIWLPTLSEQHHVSFKPDEQVGYLYSDEPKKFERSVIKVSDITRRYETEISRSESEERFGKLFDFFTRFDPASGRIAEKAESLVGAVAIAAHFSLDLQMAIISPPWLRLENAI